MSLTGTFVIILGYSDSLAHPTHIVVSLHRSHFVAAGTIVLPDHDRFPGVVGHFAAAATTDIGVLISKKLPMCLHTIFINPN